MLLFSKKMYRPTQAMELKFCCLNWKPLFELYKSFKNLLKEDEKKLFSGIFGYKWKKRFYWKWREDWRIKKSAVIRRIGNMLAGKIPSCLICFSVWEIRGKKQSNGADINEKYLKVMNFINSLNCFRLKPYHCSINKYMSFFLMALKRKKNAICILIDLNLIIYCLNAFLLMYISWMKNYFTYINFNLLASLL